MRVVPLEPKLLSASIQDASFAIQQRYATDPCTCAHARGRGWAVRFLPSELKHFTNHPNKLVMAVLLSSARSCTTPSDDWTTDPSLSRSRRRRSAWKNQTNWSDHSPVYVYCNIGGLISRTGNLECSLPMLVRCSPAIQGCSCAKRTTSLTSHARICEFLERCVASTSVNAWVNHDSRTPSLPAIGARMRRGPIISAVPWQTHATRNKNHHVPEESSHSLKTIR
jgi:hypothetical protein